VISGQVIRKENSASTLLFRLANNGSYNGLFQRMDRVVVFLKRVKMQQVFSGYLDTVPFAQLYGGPAEYKATCTLKRLMHTWWTPTLGASGLLLQQNLWGEDPDAQGNRPADSGLGRLLQEMMVRVGGWQPSDLYIQNFPSVFYNFLQTSLAAKRDANKAQAEEFRKLLLGTAYNQTAPGNFAGWSNAAGPAGAPGKGELHYIAQIVAACDTLGLGPDTTDVTTSQQLAQNALETAQGTRDSSVRSGLTQLGEIQAGLNQAYLNNDAAILGVACAMVETGGGTTILNLANASVAESLNYNPDGVGGDHDSIGIFQQRQVGWGTVSQRMDPRQAATMFFRKLPVGWRNLDPGDAIQRVQNSGFPEKYSAAIPLAQQKVRAYRDAQKGATSTVASTPLGATVTAAGDVVGINPSAVLDEPTSSPQTITEARQRIGKPSPDSESAVQEALRQLGKPYVWGAEGPNAFDCSGLMNWAFRAAGKEVPGYTYSIRDSIPRVDPALIERGDMIVCYGGGHVVMYLGAVSSWGLDMCVEAYTTGQPVSVRPAPPRSSWQSVNRVCPNGGEDLTAPRLANPLTSTGTPAGTGDYYATGSDSGQVTEPIAQNLFSFFFTPDRFARETSELFYADHKEFIDSEPLMTMIQSVSRASLRNFASSPSGEFMAYYPDYFGLDGKKAIVRLEDIELKDVKINFSDDNLTTHVYVAGDNLSQLGNEPSVEAWLQSAGSVTVEHDWLFERLRRIAPGDMGGLSGADLMKRFGVRPIKVPVAMAGRETLEFLLAAQIFMEKWAQQYQTTCQFTFLPELFPGMRVILAGHGLQVYVSEVTHTFDFENGFSTSAVIMAPSRTDSATAMSDTTGNFGDPNDENINRGLGFGQNGTTLSEAGPS
jgi:cell wall-associated NlpC family hydrolase